MDVSHIIDSLNEPQRQAVTCGPTSQLVLAGAGSGKTRVLVHRIAWLIEVEKIPAFGILAVTFTNKAASEMRGRIEELLGTPAGGMWVGTFHGLAHRLLRRHWQEAGLPQQFQILDSDDQLRMVKRAIRSLDLDDKQWPPKQSQWYINARKDEGMRPQHIEDMGDATTQQLVSIYATYEALCKRAGVVDFAELLLRSLELIRNNPELLQHYQQRFRHILIDEFQDTNELQYAWLRLLAGAKNPVFAVGDDDQSIYGWRGAKIENIQNFPRDYPDSQMIKMEQNYRSTSIILDAANAIIANNSGRLGKNLWTDDEHGDPIKLYSAFNEIDEASFIAGQIQRWVELGELRKDASILYRSNAQSRVFESTFIEQGIPYQVYGGQRFFERAEIKDALAYLRITANRDDDTSFERIVNHPPRGIGEKTVNTLRELARAENLSLWEAAKRSLADDLLNNRAKTAIEKFIALINELSIDIEALTLNEQVNQVIETSCLKGHYLKREGEDKGRNRGENLDELVSAANSFQYKPEDEHANMDTLSAFLTHAALEAGNAQGDSEEDCVQMMTMHSAKGLEFPLVFIAGLEEGLFPHQNSINEEGRLEEERRLFYVAITRARKQLFISYAEQRQLYGNTLLGIPSQFIREIPKELLDEIRPHITAYSAPNTRAYGNTKIVEKSASGFSSGDYVRHEKFGDGTIITIEGSGQSARVQINFSEVGSKWLVMGYANLQKL